MPPELSSMCDGCAVSDGWHGLIRKLCEDIMATNPPEDLKFAQVKEKFGQLRIYSDNNTEEVDALIEPRKNLFVYANTVDQKKTSPPKENGC